MQRFTLLVAAIMPLCGAAADLSLPQAQALALDRSLLLRAQDARAASSLDMARAAERLPDPVLKLGVDNVPVEGGDRFSLTRDFMTMRRIGLMQEWTRADKRTLRRERYEREADLARAEGSADRAAIQRDTALAWLEAYFAERMAQAARDFVQATQAESVGADAGYRSGRNPQAAVFATRSAVAMAEDRRIELDRKSRTARIELARWTGEPAAGPGPDLPPMASVHLENGPLAAHLALHPELLALSRRVEVAQAEVKIADAAKRPDWTIEAAYQQRGAAFSNMVSVGVSIPLPWDAANRQDREVAAKRALVDEALARRDEMLRGHLAEVASMLEEWHSGRERQARFRRDIVPLAGERTSAVVAAFSGGKASLDEVLAARRNETDVRLQQLQLDLDVAKLWARLEFLIPAQWPEATK